MDIIFKTIFGSHLYGTNIENSDMDFKIIYAPSQKDLITGKVKPFSSIHQSNKISQLPHPIEGGACKSSS